MNGSRCNSPYERDDNSRHDLLEPELPKYSDNTVRRAFIVWLRCGQRNKFRDVCNFYHQLEALEATMSPSRRASSRQHEFNMFKNEPPTSAYLKLLFPHLYTEDLDQCIQEVKDKEDKAILQEFERRQEEAAKSEIVRASTLIRNYCLANKKSLADFLFEFKEHTRKCGLVHNVFNVMFYIRRKSLNCELKNIVNSSMNLNHNIVHTHTHFDDNGDESKQLPNISKNTKRITILTNESRKNGHSDQINNK